MSTFSVKARPFDFEAPTEATALVVIDMQNDFCNEQGYLALGGADVSLVRGSVEPIRKVLEVVRRLGLLVIFTRESHRPDLSDLPAVKQAMVARHGVRIGDPGPLGRILIRGSKSNEIIEELQPLSGEIVIDKSGKGAFYGTDLEILLRTRGITHLVFTGVTTNVCVQSTIREAADRGFWNLVLDDATAAISQELHKSSLELLTYRGIFAQASSSEDLLKALPKPR